MVDTLQAYDYFYGAEAEQFSFFRIPKALFREACFARLETDAKLLYGLMLDRMDLSKKNGWIDDQNRVYIIFTTEDVCEEMNCATAKAVSLMKRLDEYGLIERKRRGQGKPSLIYIKNYCRETSTPPDGPDKNPKGTKKTDTPNSIINTEDLSSGVFLAQNQNSRISEIETQDFQKSKLKNFENQNSRISEIETQEFRKSKRNHTNNNNTNRIIHSFIPTSNTVNISSSGMPEGMKECVCVSERDVMAQIGYDTLVGRHPDDSDRIDEIVMIITDALNNTRATKIKGQEKPPEIIRSRFLKLNAAHIEHVLNTLKTVTGSVKNVCGYITSMLYEAPAKSPIQINTELAAPNKQFVQNKSAPINRFNSFEQREIDFDEAESMVFGWGKDIDPVGQETNTAAAYRKETPEAPKTAFNWKDLLKDEYDTSAYGETDLRMAVSQVLLEMDDLYGEGKYSFDEALKNVLALFNNLKKREDVEGEEVMPLCS